jgi:hypothetical protein
LVVSGNHALTLNGAYTATIDGIAIEQAGTGSSDEAFRCIPGTADAVTIKNSLLQCSTTTNQQDCIYLGFNVDVGTTTIEQCSLSGAGRGGVHSQVSYSAAKSGTLNINSCSIVKCGGTGTGTGVGVASGGIYISASPETIDQTALTFNVHNCIVVDNTTYTYAQDFLTEGTTSPPTYNVSYSIDSDGSIATDTDGGTGNLASRTATDSASPGAGDWVVFEDITSVPYDLRLQDNAENDAQDAHTTATAHGLTIPSTDIVGTSRPVNTSYDIGCFEIAASGGVTVNLTGQSATGGVGTLSIAGGASLSIAGVGGAGAVGAVGSAGAAIAALSGVGAAGGAGNLTAVGAALAALAGVVGTGQVGTITVTVAGGVSVTLTGVSGTGGIGTLAAVGAALQELTGVSGAGAPGTLSPTGGAVQTLTGVSGTGAPGDLTAAGGALQQLSGVAGTGASGDLSAIGAAVQALTGVGGTGAPGDLSITGGATQALTGVAGAGQVGDLTAAISMIVALSGVSASGAAGVISTITAAVVQLQGVAATGQAGTITIPLPSDQAGELLATITITAGIAGNLGITPGIVGNPKIH